MTTNANLLPGTLIEYKSAHSNEKAWVLSEPTAEGVVSEGMVKIRVRGETGINTDAEFDIYVKAKGRAKILEMTTEAAEAELNRSSNALRAKNRAKKAPPVHDAGDYVNADGTKTDGQIGSKPRTTSSHIDCTHEITKAGRAACRKARARAAQG